MDPVLEFLYPKLILFVVGFWSFVFTYFLNLLGYVTSFRRNGGSIKGISNDSEVVLTEAMTEKQEFLEVSSKENNDEKEDETEAPEFSFTFKFPTFEEFIKKHDDLSQLVEPSTYVHEKNVNETTDSHEVSSENFSEIVDSHEFSSETSEIDANSNGGFVLDECQVHEFPKGYDDQRDNDFEDQECVVEKIIIDSLTERKIEDIEEKEDIDTLTEVNSQKVDDISVDSSADSYIDLVNLNSPRSPTIELNLEDGFLSDGDFELIFDEKDEKEHNNWKESNFLSENDFVAKSTDANGHENASADGNGKDKNLSNDTTNKLESLWEHQELLEQLKMEIKKVRAIGLPTIFEESESPPKIVEELKPWKIEEVYQHGGNMMVEVHKFYKSYRERMRKFDIFNYQKMYAIGT